MKVSNWVPDGVLALILVGKNHDNLSQKFLLIEDHDDRGSGTGIKKIGLPGGAIEEGETPEEALVREIYEEVNLRLELESIQKIGQFSKTRPNGYINQNHLFLINLPDLDGFNFKTNDEREVSEILLLPFSEIISFARIGVMHEGSIRLFCKAMKGETTGSLNEIVVYECDRF